MNPELSEMRIRAWLLSLVRHRTATRRCTSDMNAEPGRFVDFETTAKFSVVANDSRNVGATSFPYLRALISGR